jgi:hypothetical protein
MFDIDAYYAQVRSGQRPDLDGLIGYVSRFDRVILWGAGVIGEAVGALLQSRNVTISSYWDRRSAELGKVNGIAVTQPFENIGRNQDGVLVIVCVSSLMAGELIQETGHRGYANVLHGYYLFQGHICPFDAESSINPRTCHTMPGCNPAWCDRLHGIVRAKHTRVDAEPLHINVLSYIVNQRCTLSCKHCTSYINRYAPDERVDFPLERILEDIDKVLEAVDSVGHITIMGGEPFLHRHISAICQRFSEKPNFGTAIVATSATCLIRPEQLEGFKDPRICVSIVNYLDALPKPFTPIYQKNLKLLSDRGILHRANPATPEWRVPSTLYDLGDSEETLIKKKEHCCFPTYAQVKNGRLHLCDFANALSSLYVADYPDDCVEISGADSPAELRQRIRAWIDRPFFKTCGHCTGSLGLVAQAAEQGYMDFMHPLTGDANPAASPEPSPNGPTPAATHE